MNPLVSINCITYNHEPYIGDAIESFIMQQTDFEFEILIGEDCSTDRTREIIAEYVRLYPKRIKLITSEKNVGGMQNFYRLHQSSKGKYIAVCEGDDYWTDPFKLQKQVNYLENNPECTLCFHNGEVIDLYRNKVGRNVLPWMKSNEKYYENRNRKYSAGELALLGFIPTASYIYPKQILDNPPEWCLHSVVGDNIIKLITASHGYAYYMNENMCVYRFGVPGSATTKWIKDHNTLEKRIRHNQGFIDIFDNFNRYSDFKYKKEIDLAKQIFEFQISIINADWREITSIKYADMFNELSARQKILTYIRAYFPRLYERLLYVKNKLRTK